MVMNDKTFTEFLAELKKECKAKGSDMHIKMKPGESLTVSVEGYEAVASAEWILELCWEDKKLKAFCWADGEEESPTDIINFEGARKI
jgi:hypothetical protein